MHVRGSLLPFVRLVFHQVLIARRGGLLRSRSNATPRSGSELSRPAGSRGNQAETRGRPRGRNYRESALLPRRLSRPSRAPDRGRRTVPSRPDGRGAPVRRSPGAFGTVPGCREKSVGKTVGKSGRGAAAGSVAPRCRPLRARPRAPWPSLGCVGRGPQFGRSEAERRRRPDGEVFTGNGRGRNGPARRDRSRRQRRAASWPASILRLASGWPLGRSVRSRPEEVSTVRRVPVQIVGSNEGTKFGGAAGSLLLAVVCRLSAALITVAASFRDVPHEGGRQHVLEPPSTGPLFKLLCR